MNKIFYQLKVVVFLFFLFAVGLNSAFAEGKIVYSNNCTGWRIYIMDEDGSNPVQLTTGPGIDGGPKWSPMVN